jgi:rubrerythrin
MADVKKDRDIKDGKKEETGMVGGAFAGGAVGGAAGGALAGAAAGGLTGPAGAAIGAVVGAVAGAIGGKAIADRINPEAEQDYWRTNYSSRPYVTKGSTYEDYGPAYKLGYERYPDYHGRTFDEAEADLQRDWDARRGGSRLSWTQARQATRDAFDRAKDSVSRATTGDDLDDRREEVCEDLNKLLRGELAATETYRQALDKVRSEYGNDAKFQQLAQIQRDHEQATAELRTLIQQKGGVPSDDSGAWGTWSNTVMGAARVFGDKAALSALLSGERSGVDDYEDVLKETRTPDDVRHKFRSLLTRNQEHIGKLEQLIDAT